MTRRAHIKHTFVDSMPEQLEEGVVYVSIKFATVLHMCCCGCGEEVVTPLSPTDWAVTFDGKTVSLNPSIGNWSYACKSHYWIHQNTVKWAGEWSAAQVEAGRRQNAAAKRQQFNKPSEARNIEVPKTLDIEQARASHPSPHSGWINRIRGWLGV